MRWRVAGEAGSCSTNDLVRKDRTGQSVQVNPDDGDIFMSESMPAAHGDPVDGTSAGDTAPTSDPIEVVVDVADPVAARLTELGVESDKIARIVAEFGATSVEDLGGLTEADL